VGWVFDVRDGVVPADARAGREQATQPGDHGASSSRGSLVSSSKTTIPSTVMQRGQPGWTLKSAVALRSVMVNPS
jgi:hypothetical protein